MYAGRAEELALAGQADLGEGLAGRRGSSGTFVDVQHSMVVVAAVDEAEVHDADAAVGADHDVVGLEVAVDEAGGVGGRDAAGGVEEDVEELGPAAGFGAGPRVEGLAGDELHGDPDAVAVGADVVDRHDVGVGEPGEGLGLAQQAEPRRRTAAGRGRRSLRATLRSSSGSKAA
jgi:hypothetical protein